jgi:hypothetical protein
VFSFTEEHLRRRRSRRYVFSAAESAAPAALSRTHRSRPLLIGPISHLSVELFPCSMSTARPSKSAA